MARLCGACCGLTVFSALILNGLYLGIQVETIVLRAVTGLFGGLFLGLTLGYLATIVIKENASPTGQRSAVAEQTPPAGQESA